MKRNQKLLSLFVLLSLTLSACTVSSTKEVNVNVNGKNIIDAKAGFDTSDPNLFDFDLNTSDYKKMNFGKQGNTPVSWFVVYDDGDHYVLFSEKVLDVKLYNSTNKKTEWGDTTLYEYLNTDFINEYFSKEERERMIFTNDKDDCMVTMASTDNLIDLYGDIYYAIEGYYGSEDYFQPNEKIIAKPMEAAINNDIYPFNNDDFAEIVQAESVDRRYDFANGAVPYWLLNQDDDGMPYTVTGTGYISIEEPTQGYIGIRPIIRIKKP